MPYVRRRRKRSPVNLFFAVGAVVLIMGVIGYFGVKRYRAAQRFAAFDENLKQVVARRNASLPELVTPGIREDSVAVGPDHSFFYHYTLVSLGAAIITPKALNDHLRPMLIESYRSDPRMQNFREHNEVLHYQYSDSGGNQIAEIIIGPDDIK